MKKERKKQQDFLKKLTEKLDLPDENTGGSYRVELTESKRALIYGCRHIDEYDEKQMTIAVKGGKRVAIKGSGLVCEAYHGRALEVKGDITGVEFIEKTPSK